MKTFNVYTGDGNFGTFRDHEIEAEDLDGAVKIYMDGVDPNYRDDFVEDGEEHVAYLTLYEVEGEEGPVRAFNGGAFFVAEIWDAEHDPRVQPV